MKIVWEDSEKWIGEKTKAKLEEEFTSICGEIPGDGEDSDGIILGTLLRIAEYLDVFSDLQHELKSSMSEDDTKEYLKDPWWGDFS